MKKDLSALEKDLGVKFKETDLLQQALTHRSYLNEITRKRSQHNERLEFLGDAVLELAVTRFLFLTYPTKPEGELTNWRAALVNSRMLSTVAQSLTIDNFLFMSKGEQANTGRSRRYLLANALEALIGAIYLDQGFLKARQFVEKKIICHLKEILDKELYKDPKSLLQEIIQEKHGMTPHYQLLKEWGPDHEKKFSIAVYADEKKLGQGDGKSKQEAEEQAAKKALEKLT